MVKFQVINRWDVVAVVVSVVVVVVVVVIVVVVNPLNLLLKLGQNQVINRWDVVDVVVVGVVVSVVVVVVVFVVVVIVVVVVVVVVHPRNLSLKFGWNRVSNSCVIADIEFVWVVGGGGLKSFSCHTQLLSWVEVELGLWQF